MVNRYIVRRTYVFIGFANFYQRFIQDFSRIATSPTAVLQATGPSVASAFRVDDDEIVGGGGGGTGAENGGSIVKRKVNSITLDRTQLPQITGLIAKEAPTKVPDKYVTLWTCSLRTWLSNSPSTLRTTTMLSNWSMPTGSSNHLNYPQVLLSFPTGSRTDLFGCVSNIEASITS